MPGCVPNSHFRNPSAYEFSSSTVGPECQLPVDIILKSSNGILLEVVDFEETSETLSYLLRFMHKVQYPDLSELIGKRLFELADAAEKWRVLSAMAVCNAHILSNQTVLEKHPFECLSYSMKYGYPKVADVAAPYIIAESFNVVVKRLGHDRSVIYAWVCGLVLNLKYRY
ncbi:hypothetical protein H1R20_g6602, partial [Candolleomyces eurysporus]